MPYNRYLRLRLCLATTPPPTSHQLPCLHIHPQPASVACREPSPSSPVEQFNWHKESGFYRPYV
nr:hypothetical protein Iba_chr07bCG5000 [Ipomoea batatas]